MILTVEIFGTPELRTRGLMFRESLGIDSGALFIFDSPTELSFWGRNTLLDLDIAFIREDWTIESIKTIHSLDESQVASDGPCVAAIEVPNEWFRQHGIEPGSRVDWEQGATQLHIETDFEARSHEASKQGTCEICGAPTDSVFVELCPKCKQARVHAIIRREAGVTFVEYAE